MEGLLVGGFWIQELGTWPVPDGATHRLNKEVVRDTPGANAVT